MKRLDQRTPESAAEQPERPARRGFLGKVGGATALGLSGAATDLALSAPAGAQPSRAAGTRRARKSFEIREKAALTELQVPTPDNVSNGDEQRYSNFIGNFAISLPHDPATGLVDPAAYQNYIAAAAAGTTEAFEAVPWGGFVPFLGPMGAVGFDLEGTDSHQTKVAPAPAVASQARADDMVELYWMALCRDVPFTQYGSDPATQAAAQELSGLGAFAGPRAHGDVTAKTLFRGFSAEDTVGPLASQYLMKPFAFGTLLFNSYPVLTGQINTYAAGVDYVTDEATWLKALNGQIPPGPQQMDPVLRYPRNGRDLSALVHWGGEPEPFFAAMQWLYSIGAPLNAGNPYRNLHRQTPFATLGPVNMIGLLFETWVRALKAVWYHKINVHRTLRPIEYGGLVHKTLSGQATYPVHADVLNSQAVARVFSRHGTYLLPHAYPEGAPALPSYPAGHATAAGACATILKAVFDGSTPFAQLAPIVTSTDGVTLDPYDRPDAARMTVNSEINKLAAHVALGRNWGGIHWRSDDSSGLKLGEAVALSILRDQHATYGEQFSGFVIKKFDGETVVI